MQLRDPHRKTLNLKSKLSTLYAYYGNRKSHIKGKKMFFLISFSMLRQPTELKIKIQQDVQ